MDEQQSQKRGAESDSQKQAGRRSETDSTGQKAPDRHSDKDAALGIDSGRRAQREKPWNEREKSENV